MNPFVTNIRGFGGKRIAETTAAGRIEMVRRFDVAQCEAALKLRFVQKTVRVALRRRLRELQAAP